MRAGGQADGWAGWQAGRQEEEEEESSALQQIWGRKVAMRDCIATLHWVKGCVCRIIIIKTSFVDGSVCPPDQKLQENKFFNRIMSTTNATDFG